MANENNSTSILIPAPTAWPFIAALGITLVFTGLVTHAAVSIVGAAVLLRAAIGWWVDGLPDQEEKIALVSPADRRGAEVPVSSFAADHPSPVVRAPPAPT